MKPQSPWLTLKPDTVIAARIAAIAEPGFVLVAGTLLAGIVLGHVQAGSVNHFLYSLATPDFSSAASVLFVDLAVRYAIVLGLAAALGLWRGRSSRVSYGVTLGNGGLGGLVGIGIVLGLIASLPIQVVRLANIYMSLGPGTRFWALEARVPWNADFWLYMAVGSFLVVPVFEELYTRGYLLGRLRESFSAGGSLLVMSVFFAFAHGQYHHLDMLAASDEASLLVWALILGYAVYRTGSLVPAIVAHGIVNTPMTANLYWVMLVASVLAVAACRRSVLSWLAGVTRLLREIDDWPATLLAVFLFVLMMMTIRATSWMPYTWLGVFCLGSVFGVTRVSPWKIIR